MRLRAVLLRADVGMSRDGLSPDGSPPGTADAAAWRAFRAELLGRVRRRVPDPADAEDIVQAVLETLVARRTAVADPAKLPAWLSRVTANAIADHWRRVGRHRRRIAPLDPEAAPPAAPAMDDPALGRAAMLGCLAPLMARLSPSDRRILVLADGHGRPQAEVAAAFGLRLSATKSRIHRARRRLAALVEACCAVERDARGAVTGWARDGCCDGSTSGAPVD